MQMPIKVHASRATNMNVSNSDLYLIIEGLQIKMKETRLSLDMVVGHISCILVSPKWDLNLLMQSSFCTRACSSRQQERKQCWIKYLNLRGNDSACAPLLEGNKLIAPLSMSKEENGPKLDFFMEN